MKPLLDVVKQYLLEKGEETPHLTRRALNAAIQVVKMLHWDVDGVPITDLFTLTSNKQILIPDDMVKVIEVYTTASGSKVTLTPSADLALLRTTDDCGNITLTQTDGVPSSAITNYPSTIHYNNHGENIGRYYGVNSSSIGSYVIDDEKGVIQIDPNSPFTKLYITYLSDVSRVNGKFLVDPMAEECLLAGIRWVMNRGKSNRVIGYNEKKGLELDFDAQRRAYIEKLQPALTKQTAISLARSGQKQSKF
jgi:hypothetical protein